MVKINSYNSIKYMKAKATAKMQTGKISNEKTDVGFSY